MALTRALIASGVLAAVMLVTLVGACKPTTNARVPLTPVPASRGPAPETQTKATPGHAPAEEAFVVPDDAPVDPAEALHALKHDCCDEMSPDQVKAHSQASESAAPAQTFKVSRVPRP